MASGFELSVYDLRSLSRSIATETDIISERVHDLHASSVDRTDFGSDEQDGVGAGYVRMVHGVLADALLGVRSAGERFAAELEEMSRHYESAEEDLGARFRVLEEDSAEASGA